MILLFTVKQLIVVTNESLDLGYLAKKKKCIVNIKYNIIQNVFLV